MAEAVAYPVEVKPDFVARQTKAQPVAALAELIWNALDADATEVDIELDHDGLGTLSKIAVSDNGHGIPHADAPVLFKSLGGSWKKHGAKTKERGRALHGQEGRGRFKALALGRAVEWKVITGEPSHLRMMGVVLRHPELEVVAVARQRPGFAAVRSVALHVSHEAVNCVVVVLGRIAHTEAFGPALGHLNRFRDDPVSPGLAGWAWP